MKKKICFLTSTRADYGLQKNLIKKFKSNKDIETKIIACGTHFSAKFGNTIKEIKKDSLKVDFNIKINISDDSAYGSSNFFASLSSKFNKIIRKVNPDLLIILGDRFEMLAAASIAVIHNIPICHLHGGESTEGVIDDSIRHAITKLSSLHFVAHKKYRDRVIQMGENPKNVHCVGALGLGSIINKNFSNKLQIENLLNIKMRDKNFIVTYHPVTLTKNSIKDITELFSALNFFKEICFIITSPNMDTEHNKIITKIKNFVKKNDNVYFFKSLGKETYFDLLNSFDGVLGNSSSGIIELPSFKKATINIGERQKGRIQSKSVINCKPLKKDIINSVKKIFSYKFKKKLKKIKNPYHLEGTENKIFEIIKKTNLKDLKRKIFFDNV